jgi:selenocysteine lyase/cysteine desulfurase
MAHKTIGTFPTGTVRVSPGYFTTDEEIDRFLEALQHIAGQ